MSPKLPESRYVLLRLVSAYSWDSASEAVYGWFPSLEACHTSEATKEGATITQRNDRITAATPTLTHLIWLSSISVQESVVFVPLFLPRLGVCPSPRKNSSFDSGSGHVVLSGKNNGGVAANVMRHARRRQVK